MWGGGGGSIMQKQNLYKEREKKKEGQLEEMDSLCCAAGATFGIVRYYKLLKRVATMPLT